MLKRTRGVVTIILLACTPFAIAAEEPDQPAPEKNQPAEPKDEPAKKEPDAKLIAGQLAKAKALDNQGKLSAARKTLTALLKKAPDNAEARKLLGAVKAKIKANVELQREVEAARKAKADQKPDEKDPDPQKKPAEKPAEKPDKKPKKADQPEKPGPDEKLVARRLARAKAYYQQGKFIQAEAVVRILLQDDADNTEAKQLLKQVTAKRKAQRAAARAKQPAKPADDDQPKKQAAKPEDKPEDEKKPPKQAAEADDDQKKQPDDEPKQQAAKPDDKPAGGDKPAAKPADDDQPKKQATKPEDKPEDEKKPATGVAGRMDRAKGFYEDGELVRAEAVLRILLQDDPDNAEAKKLLEQVEDARKEQDQQAARAKAAEEEKKRREAEEMKARIAEKKRLAAKAAEEERQRRALLMAKNKERSSMLFQRAAGLYTSGDLVRAKATLNKIPEVNPYKNQVDQLRRLVDQSIAELDRAEAEAAEKAEQQEFEAYALYKSAREDYWKRHFDSAIAKCQEILDTQPHHRKARTLFNDARMAKAFAAIEAKAVEQELSVLSLDAEAETAATVPAPPAPEKRPDPIVFENPREYDNKPLDEKLDQLISVNLDAAPLEYLLDIIFRATGVSIIVDPAAIEGKSLSIHVEDITLRELLEYITKNLGMQFSMGKDAIWITAEEPMLTYRIFPLTHGRTNITADDPPLEDSDLELLMEELPNLIDWPDGSAYYLVRRSNVLVVRSTSEVLKDVAALIKTVDMEAPQVLIEAKFIEVDTGAFEDLGIDINTTDDWSIQSKDGLDKVHIDAGVGGTFPQELAGGAEFPNAASSGLTATLTGVLTEPKFQATLQALRSKANATTLAEPKLLTLSNSTAEIEITRDLWYVEDFDVDRTNLSGTSVGSSYLNNNNDLLDQLSGLGGTSGMTSLSEPIIVPVYTQSDPTGFILAITPSVGADRRKVTLLLEPEIREEIQRLSTEIVIPNTEQTATVERPVISTRALITKMTIDDGHWVMIGGLLRQQKEDRVSKVPILGDLPLIKYFFRRTTSRVTKRNLLIFVRAKVTNPRGGGYYDEEDVREARADAADMELSNDVEVLFEKNTTSTKE